MLESYGDEMQNLISRRRDNDTRKYTSDLYVRILKRIVERIDGNEHIFIIDFKPVPVKVCQFPRGKLNRMVMKESEKSVGL